MKIARLGQAALILSKRGQYILFAKDEEDAQLLMYLLYSQDMNEGLAAMIFGDGSKGNDGQ